VPSIKGFHLEDLNIFLAMLQEKTKKNWDAKCTPLGELIENDLFSIYSPTYLTKGQKTYEQK
jgi:hypothetical protein